MPDSTVISVGDHLHTVEWERGSISLEAARRMLDETMANFPSLAELAQVQTRDNLGMVFPDHPGHYPSHKVKSVWYGSRAKEEPTEPAMKYASTPAMRAAGSLVVQPPPTVWDFIEDE